MAAVSTWSKTAASNNATPPDGWPEGQNPSTVNDCAREMMASLRTRFEDLEWFNYGHVLVRQSANSFLVSSTVTQVYTAGRRLKLYDATTIYGEVLASSPSGANTLITVSSSSLTSSLTSGEVGIINAAAGLSLPSPTTLRANTSWPILISGTQVDTSTGATSYDLSTTIPSWVKRITLTFEGFSTNGTSIPIIQIGDSGGYEIAGYTSLGLTMDILNTAQTTGFALAGNHAASRVLHGQAILVLKNSATFTWSFNSQLMDSAGPLFVLGSGTKSLTTTLDRVRITTVAGADTGDAGSINIIYE